MRENLQIYLEWISKSGVMVITLLTLLLFWNLTTDYFETPKFLALVVFTAVFLVLYILNFLLQGRVIFTRTPFDIPLLIILVTAAISPFLSPSVNTAIFGNMARVHGSLMSIVVYIIFYFLLVSHLKKAAFVSQIIYVIIFGGALLSLLSLLLFFGIKWLPVSWASGLNFTPTGATFSTNAVLIMMLPILIIRAVMDSNIVNRSIHSIALGLFLINIALTGTQTIYWVTLAVLLITLFAIRKQLGDLKEDLQKNLPFLAFLVGPLIAAAIIFTFSQIPPVGPPAGGGKNPLYTFYQNYPRELQLPFLTSWKVSVSAFRDSPIIGTGPATHLFNFTTYKPVEFNSSKYWNLRFDTPFNEYLGFLATLGGAGFIGLVILTIVYFSTALKTIAFSSTTDEYGQLNKGLALAGLAFFMLLLLHPSTLVLWVIGLLMLACFVSLNRQLLQNTSLKTESLNPSNLKFNFDALPALALMVLVALTGVGFVFVGKFALADFHHRKALDAVVQNQVLVAYNELVAAENLNPKIDLYRTDLAQTNFALANAIASAKGPTEASPSGSLTDQDKTNIQQLLSQAIAEGRNATFISPRNVSNWEVLGNIYRQISGVAQNALQFALDSYGRAIALDPLNPNLRLNVGGIYYSLKNYDLAIRFFTDAVNLKPDLPNAYYNLSVALRDKGDLRSAQATAERVMALLDPASGDYKTAADYLSDLKARIATTSTGSTPLTTSSLSTGGSTITPPAAQENSALQKQNLPKVLDLPKKEDIATPEAVKK